MGSDAYAVTRERDGTYQLHSTVPNARIIARIAPVLDRAGQVLGWKLKPLVVMHGAVSRLWPDPATALAATKLFTPGKARTAVRAAAQAAQASRAPSAKRSEPRPDQAETGDAP